MRQIAENAHILQKVYNLKSTNKLFLANHYHFQDHTDLIFDKNIMMPLFKLSIANGISKHSIKPLYLKSEYKKEELYNCNTFLVLSTYSDMAVYRSKTIYSKRDGLEQIFKFLASPNHTYNLHLNLLSYFIPQRVLFKQVLQALSLLQLLDEKQLFTLGVTKQQNYSVQDRQLGQILWGNQEFVDHEKWQRLLKKNAIVNLKQLHLFPLSQQIIGSYFLTYNKHEQHKEDIIKLNKYFVEDFDMFAFRFKLEHNEKQMRYYFLRMIKKLEMNSELEYLIRVYLKSFGLDWNKQLFIELKSIINQQNQ